MMFESFWKITVTQTQKSNSKHNHSKIRLHSAAAVNPESDKVPTFKVDVKSVLFLTDTSSVSDTD